MFVNAQFLLNGIDSIDDLNALYVYESKMSLFIRIAHSRAGAERLLDANIISVLGRCDYLDARPEGDQDFMGMCYYFTDTLRVCPDVSSFSLDQDTFLPSAVQRYHQLFMPAVELVNAIVATLGSKHASATNQVPDSVLSMGTVLTNLWRRH